MICGDCIHKEVCGLESYYDEALITCTDKTELPHNTGHWIFVDKAHEHAHCSECDYGNVDLLDGRSHNYCPNCGAKMVSHKKGVIRNDTGRCD